MKGTTHLPSPAHGTIYAKVLDRYQASGNFIDEVVQFLGFQIQALLIECYSS